MTDADAPDRTVSVREIFGPHAALQFEGTAWLAKYETPGLDTTRDEVLAAIESGQLTVAAQDGDMDDWRVTLDSFLAWHNARGLEFTRQLVDRWNRGRADTSDS